MDLWLGLGVVVVVLALSYFSPRRKCGGCRSCATGCRDEENCAPAKSEMANAEFDGSSNQPEADFEISSK